VSSRKRKKPSSYNEFMRQQRPAEPASCVPIPTAAHCPYDAPPTPALWEVSPISSTSTAGPSTAPSGRRSSPEPALRSPGKAATGSARSGGPPFKIRARRSQKNPWPPFRADSSYSSEAEVPMQLPPEIDPSVLNSAADSGSAPMFHGDARPLREGA
jgi:hypothetical protein